MKKAIVFTMDAVFALYIFLIVASTFLFVLQSQTQNEDMLTLSRIARDVYETRFYGGTVDSTKFPWLEFDAACGTKKIISSEEAIVYDGDGALKKITIKVCMK
jgi:hypothetical protein